MRAVKILVVLIFLSLLISCPDYNNPLDPEADNYVGYSYAGGIIFYLDGAGGGLVAAESDQGTANVWGGYGTLVGGTSTAVGTGAANTAAIVVAFGASEPYGGKTDYAAKLCNDLVLNGYDDWFLPSKDELNLMYGQKGVIGSFAVDYYWSSSEVSSYGAGFQYFSEWGQSGGSKYVTYRVRAVRAFNY